jgi:FG-GAP-like repeat/Secretion system C-terminal sorting domain
MHKCKGCIMLYFAHFCCINCAFVVPHSAYSLVRFARSIFTSTGRSHSRCYAVNSFLLSNHRSILIICCSLMRILSALFFALSAINVSQAQSCFSAHTEFTTDNLPEFIGNADFNGDGKADLFITNYNSGTVTVKLGDGQGDFFSTLNLTCGSNPFGACAADLDGDGHDDLVVANTNGNNLTFFHGNGDGTFVSSSIPNTPQNPFAIAAGNFDDQTGLDMAIIGSTSGTVQLASSVSMIGSAMTVGLQPMDIKAIDVNGDGMDDIITANSGTNTVSLLLSNSLNQYDVALNYTVGVSPRSIAIADFNGDGLQDAAVVCDSSPLLYVLINNGNGGLTDAFSFSIPSGSNSVTAADFNGDGLVDIAMSNYQPGGIVVALNEGGSIFQIGGNYFVPGGLYAVTSCDLNGDAAPDLATANYFEHDGSLLLNQSLYVVVEEVNNSLVASIANATYQWLDCNNNMTAVDGETNQTFEFSTGSFAVQVTLNGCDVTSPCMDVLAENIIDEKEIKIRSLMVYPQPAIHEVNIKDWSGNIRILDMSGHVVLTEGAYRANASLDVSMLSTGIYMLCMQDQDATRFQKMIKMAN